MKALLINGSPRRNGNTARALQEVAARLAEHGIKSDILWIGNKAMQGCIACYYCAKEGRCVFHDEPYEAVRAKLAEADALIVGSPVYYGGPAGSLCALLDRVFLSCKPMYPGKVWASVIVCRRGGATAAFQRLNMYAEMSTMVQATSQYWNFAYGAQPGEVEQDLEGMQTMRTLADNVAWLLRCTAERRGEIPPREPWIKFNVVR